MQNSALYRRGIVLPLDPEATECLRANDVDFSTRVRVLKLSDDAAFSALSQMNFFEAINARCGTLIDEYEEEWIDASAIRDVLKVIDSATDGARDPAVVEFLAELRVLVAEAQALSLPLLFVL